MEFVINLTTINLLYAADWCGMKSGKDFNKFREMKLTPGKCQIVKAPLIEESPVNIECRVNRILPLGSHHMFIADVVAINLDEKFKENLAGNVMNSNSDLISYSFGIYYNQGKESGKYGFSSNKLK